MLRKHTKIAAVLATCALCFMPLTGACSSSSTTSSNTNGEGNTSNVIKSLNLPQTPGEYPIESNSWTTITDSIGKQVQVHIINTTDGQTFVIPYDETSMATVPNDKSILVVVDDSELENNGNMMDRGEEVKKYQLYLSSKDWSGRMQRGNGSYER